ncbi:Protein of unknown function [Anaerocolumna jejuensis DSM 15929]|uniref:DUF3793 family protein n=1 Tax=Anaerocolumna jejuensis DSM 15929 TaxID=1121322 RepID=A0A1M6MVK8_9FIRM|nr:DUF3793 family protein [Anaerocolumna jejuensis]SHJ87430.1 Protein of unknown function [Anaerocolumna jejuensis DSM 15929]
MSDDIFLIGEDRTSSYVAFTLANCCMPTLVKAKPSSLVSFRKRYIDSRDNFLKALLRESGNFGCTYRILYESETEIYIIVYNRNLLYEVLKRNAGNPLLSGNGYTLITSGLEEVMEQLMKRYGRYQQNKVMGIQKDFPHEIGIILGYPAADVEEYIRNNGENYILCGYWKVYQNADEAIKIFDTFSRIRREAVRLFFAGRPLIDIISFSPRH